MYVCMHVATYVSLNFSQLAGQITVHGISDSKPFVYRM